MITPPDASNLFDWLRYNPGYAIEDILKQFINTVESPLDIRDYEHYDKNDDEKVRDWNRWVGGIENQGSKPRCVLQSVEVLERVHTNSFRGIDCFAENSAFKMADYDAQQAYAYAKTIDGSPDQGGTYPRVGMKVWKNKGLIETSPYPGRIGTCENYWRCKSLKEAVNDLYTIGPVLITVRWYLSFSFGNGVLVPKSRDQLVGLHAMAMTRRTEKDAAEGASRGINSHGSNWGQAGHFVLPDNQWNNLVVEAWCGK